MEQLGWWSEFNEGWIGFELISMLDDDIFDLTNEMIDYIVEGEESGN